MERLTERFDGWVRRKGCYGSCVTCDGAECADIYLMIERLAAYEDTMPLERAQELSKAEKDGRLVVLPCNVGDTVWAESPIKGMVYSFEAPNISWIIESADQFGKTVFLTREEAEATLKMREENDEAD